jgi:hypothetical protein
MNRLIRSLATTLVVVASGCSQGPKLVPVTGTVTAAGQPVPNILLVFTPKEGRPSMAHADDQGKFQLMYEKDRPGAMAGTYKVTVYWSPRSMEEEMAFAKGTQKRPASLDKILAKYGSEEKTPLRVEITDANPVVDLKLD